jgi:type IV pilus assembly protein PilF
VFLSLQSCRNSEANAEHINKLNLSKAAAYNMQLGLSYLNQGDRPRAKVKLLTALKQEPTSAQAHAGMAYYFEQTNEISQAKKYYLKAISLSSDEGAQLNNYGTFLCRQGDYKTAEIYFLKAVKDMNYVHTAGAYENAGFCALAIPNNEKAQFYLTKALDQDPLRRESLYELVKLKSSMKHDNEALNLLQKHQDLVSNDRVLLSLGKNLAKKMKQFDLASEYESRFKIINY